MAYINVLSTTERSIRVNVGGLQEEYASADRVCTWYLNGDYKGTSWLGAHVSSGGAFTFSGLSPGTWYSIDVSIEGNDWGFTVDLSTSEMTDEHRVYPWSWWSSIVSGGEIQISASEWNAFCSRINEVRVYAAYPQLPSYGAFETAFSGSPISASIVNHAIWAIRAMNPPITPPREVSPGQKVTADFFISLKNALNSML